MAKRCFIDGAIRGLLLTGGVVLFALFALCWTPYPWRCYHWLSMPEATLSGEPDWIVVLGGGGIPSETGLMRTYYGAQAAHRFPSVRVIVALPGDPALPGSAVNKMRDELVLRGVPSDRIVLEPHGTSTRAQALNVRAFLKDQAQDARVLVVTSPEHMRRSVQSFRRAGVVGAVGHAASNTAADHSMEMTAETVESKLLLPGIETHLTVRYRFWNNLGYLTSSAREWTALAYYKVKGWV